MFKIIKAELNYNRFIWLMFLTLVPIVHLIEFNLGDIPKYFIFILIFLLQFYYLLFLSKEKRNLLLSGLPVNSIKLGYTRVVILILLNLIILCFYFIVILFLSGIKNFEFTVNTNGVLIFMSLNIGIMSLFYLFQDYVSTFLLANPYFRFSKEAGRNLLLTLLVLINVFGIYLNIANPRLFADFLGFIFESEPDLTDAALFGIISVILFLLTGISYSKRKYYTEL